MMTIEEHLRSVSRAASQRLGILRKSYRVFHVRSLLGRCFRGFVLPVLESCSAVWCSVVGTNLKLLDRAVSGARFLTGVVFDCDISHRRSVAVLCMCTLLMVLSLDRMCQRWLHAVLWSHIGTLVAHRCTYAPPRCRTLLYSRTFTLFSVSLWYDLTDPVFDGVELAGFKSRANASLLA